MSGTTIIFILRLAFILSPPAFEFMVGMPFSGYGHENSSLSLFPPPPPRDFWRSQQFCSRQACLNSSLVETWQKWPTPTTAKPISFNGTLAKSSASGMVGTRIASHVLAPYQNRLLKAQWVGFGHTTLSSRSRIINKLTKTYHIPVLNRRPQTANVCTQDSVLEP